MENIKNYLQVIPIIIILASCSSASKLRRAEKLIKKAELQGAKWKTDTILVSVPIPVPEIHLDSIIVTSPGDTVTIERERLRVKYVKLMGDTVFISADCLADTIYQEVPVTVIKTIEAKGFMRWWMLVLAFLAGVFLWMGYIQAKRHEKRRGTKGND